MNTLAYRNPAAGEIIRPSPKHYNVTYWSRRFLVLEVESSESSEFTYVHMKCLKTGRVFKEAAWMIRREYILLEDVE
jgi:hypothetical protein